MTHGRRPPAPSRPSPRRRGSTRRVGALALAGGLSLFGGHGHAAPPTDPASSSSAPAGDFQSLLDAWELDAAMAVLDAAPESPEREVKRGVVHVYAARYAEAKEVLATVLAAKSLENPSAEAQARHYLALATGALNALGEQPVIERREGSPFLAVFAAEKDRLLAPYFFDAMDAAYDSVGDAFGVRPTAPIRFEFLDDTAKLAMVTPLELDAIYTTGTIGITKYKRVMMVSPRVMLYGYGWLDAAVHEYVHYVVTLRTRDRAPVWMQEGLAKYFEQSWRRPGPPPLRDEVAYLLHRAIETDTLVTLEEMSPSIAMLPSRERAALAYAEVETMIGLLVRRRGPEGLAKLLDAVRDGADAKQAFSAAWGDDFEAFLASWKEDTYRATSKAREGELEGPTFAREGEAGAAETPAVDPSLFGDVFSHLGGGKARQHARLGVLLTLREHPEAAILEYERARAADPKYRNDPALAKRLGKLYLDAGDAEKAAPLLRIAGADDPEDPNVAAAEGRALLRSGDREGARAALQRALRVNPYIPSVHCDLAQLATDPERARFETSHCSE